MKPLCYFLSSATLFGLGWGSAGLARPGGSDEVAQAGSSVVQDEAGQERIPPGIDPELVERLNIQPYLDGIEGYLGKHHFVWKGENREALLTWFESGQAVLDWYFTNEHMDAVDAILTEPIERPDGPLAHLPEDAGPVLVVFYIAAEPEKPVPDGVTLPLRALSIEIYAPLPGGISLYERFSPKEFEIPPPRVPNCR